MFALRPAAKCTSKIVVMGALLGASLWLGGCRRDASATVADASTVRHYVLDMSVECPGTPEFCWSHFTGDISGWWDHSFSEAPAALVIEPVVGGRFLERFDEAGNGAVHATVTMADAPKLLRYEGAMGLSGIGLHMVHTFTFVPQTMKDGSEATRIELHLEALGPIDGELESALEAVWQHFLADRFVPYVRARAEETSGPLEPV